MVVVENFFKRVAQFQVAEGVDEGVDDGVVYDEDQVGVEVGGVVDVVGVFGVGYDEDEVEEEGGLVEDEYFQQDGDGDGFFYV